MLLVKNASKSWYPTLSMEFERWLRVSPSEASRVLLTGCLANPSSQTLLRGYQIEAINRWTGARRGIWEMATGTGRL